MKTITLEDGTKVKINEESYRNLQESVMPEFKKGVWYKYIDDLDYGGLVNYQEGGSGYGFWDNEWDNTWSISSREHWIEATKEEIKEALTKEFHKRYKKGDKVECLSNYNPKETLSGEIKKYDEGKDTLHGLNTNRIYRLTWIYKQGKWAEIVEEKKKKGWYDLIELCDNNKAEILYNGGASFNKSQLVLTFNNIKDVYKAAKRRRKYEKENR